MIEKSYSKQAKAYWLANRFLDAIALTTLGRNEADVWYYAGKSHKDLNSDDSAIDCWRKTLQIDPDHEDALRSLAWQTHEIDIYHTEVTNCLLKLTRIGKANGDDLTLLGEMYLKTNSFTEAHHWLREALSVGTKNESLTYLDLATLHAKLAIEYLQLCEDCADLDLDTPMCEEDKTEAVLRFIYEYLTVKVKNGSQELY